MLRWTQNAITVDASGRVRREARADRPPPRWGTPSAAHAYLDERMLQVDNARAQVRKDPSFGNRSALVLRVGAALDAHAVLAACGHLSAQGYAAGRLKVLRKRPGELADVQPPPRWLSPQAARDFLSERLRELDRARQQTLLTSAQAREQGSSATQRAAYAHMVVTLGAALDSVAGAYCAWWIEAEEYLFRRHQLMSVYSREQVVSLEELRAS